MSAGRGDPGVTGEQGEIGRIGGLPAGVLGLGIVEPSSAPGELTELVAAERDVRWVYRVTERTAHEGHRVAQATLLFEVVGGAGVGGEARTEVEHVLDGFRCCRGVAELGLRVGEDTVRVGRVGVHAKSTVGQIPGGGEPVAGVGERPEPDQGGRISRWPQLE